jgi:hypothetical protein
LNKVSYLDELVESGEFAFRRLELTGIDNSAVIKEQGTSMIEEEVCLFHREVSSGDEYLERLHRFVWKGLNSGRQAPVVRFADGEYAFYVGSLHCNGLYAQAESVKAINKAMPIHVKALKTLKEAGRLAPLIFPGNIECQKKSFFSFFRKTERGRSAPQFVEFLWDHGITLTKESYLPFYVVYAYLTSTRFLKAVDGKHLCMISSECDLTLCQQWFARSDSHPTLSFVEIPKAYVATQWESMKGEILRAMPRDVDICLVGAGIGALLVCVDVASEFRVPAIDAGHVLNMMNGREDKSNGARLYTVYQE